MKFAWLALGLLAACTDGGRSAPEQHLPEGDKLTLLVSNQSFEIDRVDIRVEIDEQLAVTGDFDVGSQHTWVPFDFEVAPGTHRIRVSSSDSNAVLDTTFVMDDRKWGVLNFWYYTEGELEGPFFSWDMFDEQPAFD